MATGDGRHELHFREWMRGHMGFGRLEDMTDPDLDRMGWSPLALRMRMEVPDVPRFWKEPGHQGRSRGIVDCPGLGGERPIEYGRFNLLTEGPDSGHQHMLYVMHIRDRLDREVTLAGYKDVITGGGNAWEDTTLLLTRLHRGWFDPAEEDGGEVIATGLLRIRLVNFLRQLTTFRPGPNDGLVGGLEAMVGFGTQFTLHLAAVYLLGRRRHRHPAQPDPSGH